jgi:DivIVA domain-containing protein
MPLTPEDVANKQFTSTRLKPGYDETEVDEFLDEVEAELTRLYRENDELRSKLAAAQRAAAEAGESRGPATQQMAPPPAPTPPPTPAPMPAPTPMPTAPSGGGQASETATGILALAQRTADEHIAEARTQADRIIGEARTRADHLKREADDKHRQMIGSLESERSNLERKVEELRSFEREYRSRLKSYIENQLRELVGRGSEAPSDQHGGQPGPSGSGDRPSGDRAPGGQPARSPFAPGAPVGQRGTDGPSGPPQQAPSGFIIGDGRGPRS